MFTKPRFRENDKYMLSLGVIIYENWKTFKNRYEMGAHYLPSCEKSHVK